MRPPVACRRKASRRVWYAWRRRKPGTERDRLYQHQHLGGNVLKRFRSTRAGACRSLDLRRSDRMRSARGPGQQRPRRLTQGRQSDQRVGGDLPVAIKGDRSLHYMRSAGGGAAARVYRRRKWLCLSRQIVVSPPSSLGRRRERGKRRDWCIKIVVQRSRPVYPRGVDFLRQPVTTRRLATNGSGWVVVFILKG